MRLTTGLLTSLLLGTACPAQSCDSQNVLMFGNSLSYAAPNWLETLVPHAGMPAINLDAQINGGSTLNQWVSDIPGLTNLITNSPRLAPGESWDFVIIQAYSTEPTITRGNRTRYANDLTTLFGLVRQHSPHAIAVLVHTHAYEPNHSYYPTWYPDPSAFNADVREGVEFGKQALISAFGPESCRIAHTGDAFEDQGFSANLYQPDGIHPSHHGRTLISGCLFETMYRRRFTEFSTNATPQTGPYSLYEQRILTYGMADPLFTSLAQSIDSTAHRFAGSNEDYFMAAQVNGGDWTTQDTYSITAGDTLAILNISPGGTYANTPLNLLLMHLFQAGQPVPSMGIPELHIPVGAGTDTILLPPPVGTQAQWSISIPTGLVPGIWFRLQAGTLMPSGCRANQFTTSDGCEVQIQ